MASNNYIRTIHGYTYKLRWNQDSFNFDIVLPSGEINETIIDNNFCEKHNINITELYNSIISHLDNYSYAVYYNDFHHLIFETCIKREQSFFDVQIPFIY